MTLAKPGSRPSTAGRPGSRPSTAGSRPRSAGARRPSTATSSTGGRTISRDPSRKTIIGLEATKQFTLKLELNDEVVNFGILKQGYKYSVTKTLTNRSASGLRWRINTATRRSRSALRDTTDYIQCATPRGRIAPGVTLKLSFECHASRCRHIDVWFLIEGEEPREN